MGRHHGYQHSLPDGERETQTIAQLELQKVQQELQMQMQREMQQKQQADMANVGAGGPPPPGLPNGAMTGDQVMPGFPQGATAYALNGARTPQTGVAPWVAAQGGSRDGQQMDMSYVAKRAANYVRKLDRRTAESSDAYVRGQPSALSNGPADPALPPRSTG